MDIRILKYSFFSIAEFGFNGRNLEVKEGEFHASSSGSISANDLIEDIKAKGKKAFFVEDRNQFLEKVKPSLSENSVLLLMGARDPSLEEFCKELFEKL